ncbi:MAG TPA: glycosyl hydrolase family 17 protein [Saprospiraceae bacterium]|nr:glycosyl hydrolase family 17 protein [Saprospiraceae bacterium]HMQ85438.1 glycosyl hydrolase family 17 protein [Saprospiraceae bacterium]
MSYRAERYLSLAGVKPENYLSEVSGAEIKDLFLEILNNGVYGFCFSAYEEGQKPGDILSEEQVSRRLQMLKPHTQWIRSFSCTEGNELIPRIAKSMGMKTLVGAWLGKDPELNEQEVLGLIALAKEGLVDIAAVGNEVLYRKDLSEEALLEHIQRVKAAIPEIQVGYVDAYYEFSQHPKITAACDLILANCYPYWEGCPIEDSLEYLKKMYRQAAQAGNGKKVLISETGWPSRGENLKGAVPSERHALEYFINTQMWALDEDIALFYFSSFDESWKVGAEGEVGAYWGIWDKHEKLKF